MLDWQWPWLLVLLPLPWLLRWWLPAVSHQPFAIRVPFYTTLANAAQGNSGGHYLRLRMLLAVLMWLLLIAAAARPVWFGEPVSVTTSGRDLMLAIDLSDSMRIEDMRIDGELTTRFETIQKVAGEFIERRRGDRIGLILFGQRSYLLTPLTFDRSTVAAQLDEALPGFAGSSTAIGDAIGLAITTLRDRPASSRVVILMTDGANTAGSEPNDATAIAVESGIRIHTIGVGATSLRVKDISGNESTIDPSRDLDEATLMSMAADTGGEYFRAHDPAEMASIYTVIDQLEPTPEEQLLRPQRSLYHWPLSAALACALLLLPLGSRSELPAQ